MSNKKEQIQVAAEIYARCNASNVLTVAKPMQGVWYFYSVPLTVENVAALMSTVETTEKDGLKFRFRPSNGAFYRVASANGVQPEYLASVEQVDSLVVEIAADSGCHVNRGHAVEKLIAEMNGREWQLNNLQCGFWCVPDVILADGSKAQVKAYGGSVTEKDLRTAIAACK